MIAAFVPNLMDRSRFAGVEVTFVTTAEATVGADLVLVDLDRCDDMVGFGSLTSRTVGFGSHIDEERHRGALEAGFDEVMPRSVFFRRLPRLLEAAVIEPGLTADDPNDTGTR